MRQELINQLYQILETHKHYQNYQYLRNSIPMDYKCGIYFFFDEITPISNNQFKITYIGITKNNRNNRLEKHQKNGPSSFRDHVNEAILNKYGKEQILTVDQYIHNLPYLFININDIEDLKRIEKGIIELVSNDSQDTAIDVPNNEWLGYSHSHSIIPSAHIWNIQHAGGKYSIENNYFDILNKMKSYALLMMK